MIPLEEYLANVKKERNLFFMNSFDRAYKAYIELGYDNMLPDFFESNASSIVEELRNQCWNDYLIEESDFTSKMLRVLIDDKEVGTMTPHDAIGWFVDNYPNHIYQLQLSNTQARRSRAGKEFEDIIELILLSANISVVSQGNIGKKNFVDKGLGKLVDIVSPGVIEFEENKRNTVLISAKTTLRERWQEVPEEMGRTGASEMFLATLDPSITRDVLNALYEANIQVTTTKSIKERYYSHNSRVLSFEQLIEICSDNNKRWNTYLYSKEQILQAISFTDQQISKHNNHKYVQTLFERRLSAYKEKLK